MQLRRVGASGLVVSRLGLGTMTWGRDTELSDAADQLTAFRDAGGTLVDTSDRYAGGGAEEMLGQLIGGHGREEMVVATKAGAATDLGSGSSRRHLLASLDASLRRLRTDYVDLWQLHRWDGAVPLAESMDALDAAVRSGRARYVGLSNFTGWQTAAAATWQRAWPGRTALTSAQVEYSLLARGPEPEVLPAAAHAGLGVLAWSPLGRGVLTGKYRHGVPADSRAATADYDGFVAPYLTEASGRIVDAVVTAAEGLGVAPLSVALSWVRDQPGVSAAIVGARTLGQLLGSLDSETLTLPAAIRDALGDASSP